MGPKAGTPTPSLRVAEDPYFLPERGGEGEGLGRRCSSLARSWEENASPLYDAFSTLAPHHLQAKHSCPLGWPLRTFPCHLSPQVPNHSRPNPVVISATPLGEFHSRKPAGGVGPALRGRWATRFSEVRKVTWCDNLWDQVWPAPEGRSKTDLAAGGSGDGLR